MTSELYLLLILAIIVAVSKGAGHLCQRYLKQPVVFGELLAGLLLGPTVFNLLGWPIFAGTMATGGHQPLTLWLHEQINTFAAIGVLLLMFIAGLETNLAQMRQVGKSAMVTAVIGVGLPFVLGALVARAFGLGWTEAIFLGTVLTATSVSITAQTLMEIRQLQSKEGATILGAAVIDDVLGIMLLSLVLAFTAQQPGEGAALAHAAVPKVVSAHMITVLPSWMAPQVITIIITLLCMGVFFGITVQLGRRWLPLLLERAHRLHASHAVPAAALVLVFLMAICAEYVGQVAAITGAYLVGIFIGQTRFRQEIEHAIHPFTYAFFVPIFLMSIGLGVNARALGSGSLIFTGVIILVAILSKVFGCGVGARLTGCTTPQATRIGIGMISRGEVGLIIAQIGIVCGLCSNGIYATIVLMVLATTVATPVLLRWAFPRVQEEAAVDVYESVVVPDREEEER